MDEAASLSVIEEATALYQNVLELTLRQEACLRRGDFEDLSTIVAEKSAIVMRTEVLLRDLASAPGRGSGAFQARVRSLAALVSEIVVAEERCKPFEPVVTPVPPRRMISAYAANRPGPTDTAFDGSSAHPGGTQHRNRGPRR